MKTEITSHTFKGENNGAALIYHIALIKFNT